MSLQSCRRLPGAVWVLISAGLDIALFHPAQILASFVNVHFVFVGHFSLNVAAHREGTGKEILEQTGGHLHAFVASVGTGGTLLGAAQALRAHDPGIEIYGVEPAASPHLRGGLENISIIPGITDGIIVDILKANIVTDVISVTDDEAIDMAHQLAETEGLFCGMSSGANVLAALQVARRLGKGTRVVTVLPDSRDRYLSVEKYTT